MEGIKIELFIPGDLKEEPIIFNMIRNFKVNMKIIEASFSAESGWALLIVNGDPSEMEKMYKYLRDMNITVELR